MSIVKIDTQVDLLFVNIKIVDDYEVTLIGEEVDHYDERFLAELAHVALQAIRSHLKENTE